MREYDTSRSPRGNKMRWREGKGKSKKSQGKDAKTFEENRQGKDPSTFKGRKRKKRKKKEKAKEKGEEEGEAQKKEMVEEVSRAHHKFVYEKECGKCRKTCPNVGQHDVRSILQCNNHVHLRARQHVVLHDGSPEAEPCPAQTGVKMYVTVEMRVLLKSQWQQLDWAFFSSWSERYRNHVTRRHAFKSYSSVFPDPRSDLSSSAHHEKARAKVA